MRHMNLFLPWLLMIAALQAADPQKSELASTLSHHSPDGKFAMRVVHETADEPSHSEAIRRIELVAVASGKVLAQLLPDEDVQTHFEHWRLLWSPDAKWCAFYYEHPRTGYTTVFRHANGRFAAAHKRYALRKDTTGHTRNEYIKPIRWTKEGTLILYQWTLDHGPIGGEGGGPESSWELIAGDDAKKGSFRVIKAREITEEEGEKLEEEFETNGKGSKQ